MKPYEIKHSYIAGIKLFLFRPQTYLFLGLFLIFLTVCIIISGNVDVVKYKDESAQEELMKSYEDNKEKALLLLDIYEGRIPQDRPLESDRDRAIKEIKNEIAIYDFYLETNTCENDYVPESTLQSMWSFTINANKNAAAVSNLTNISGVIFAILCCYGGFASLFPAYNKPKLFLSGGINKKSLIYGRMLFVWTLLVIFILLVAIAGTVYNFGHGANKALIISGLNVRAVNLYSLFLTRLLFICTMGFFLYNLSAFLGVLTKKPVLGFLFSFVFSALCIGAAAIIKNSAIMPVAGLLFSARGFYDTAAAYNLPLCIGGGVFFNILTVKFLKIEI